MLEQIQVPTKRETESLYYPQYRDNCISNIPDLLLGIFNIQKKTPNLIHEEKIEDIKSKYNLKIILLVIDGFGFNQYLKHYSENRFLTKLSTKGEIVPLTSVFPSQTTNALTTLNTGLTPQEHGLFEYFIYLKNIGIVNSLQFERIDYKNKQINKKLTPA